eukprot:1160679-Pelagomonas_calceolata.AAC.21
MAFQALQLGNFISFPDVFQSRNGLLNALKPGKSLLGSPPCWNCLQNMLCRNGKPIALQPRVLQPHVLQPRVLQPRVLQPCVLQPHVLQPHVLQPRVLQPRVLQPCVLQPRVLQSAIHVWGVLLQREQCDNVGWCYEGNIFCSSCLCLKIDFIPLRMR